MSHHITSWWKGLLTLAKASNSSAAACQTIESARHSLALVVSHLPEWMWRKLPVWIAFLCFGIIFLLCALGMTLSPLSSGNFDWHELSGNGKLTGENFSLFMKFFGQWRWKQKNEMCELVTTFYECLSIRNLVQFARCQLPHIVDERSTIVYFKWNMKLNFFHLLHDWL